MHPDRLSVSNSCYVTEPTEDPIDLESDLSQHLENPRSRFQFGIKMDSVGLHLKANPLPDPIRHEDVSYQIRLRPVGLHLKDQTGLQRDFTHYCICLFDLYVHHISPETPARTVPLMLCSDETLPP